MVRGTYEALASRRNVSVFLQKYIILSVHTWEKATSAHNMNTSTVCQSKDFLNLLQTLLHTHGPQNASKIKTVPWLRNLFSWPEFRTKEKKSFPSSARSPQPQSSSTTISLYKALKQGSFPFPKIRTTSCPYPFSHQHATGHFPLPLA